MPVPEDEYRRQFTTMLLDLVSKGAEPGLLVTALVDVVIKAALLDLDRTRGVDLLDSAGRMMMAESQRLSQEKKQTPQVLNTSA